MELARPLVFFDIEATGLDIQADRIIEIACVRLLPDGQRRTFESLVNPSRPIPEIVTELTGISDEDVEDQPGFSEIAMSLTMLLEDADLAGYNALGFDVPMLFEEFARVGRPLPGPEDQVVIDALDILRKNEVRTLEWTHNYYFGSGLPDAHRALADVIATANILEEQAKRYALEGSVKDIVTEMRHPYLDSRRRLKEEDGNVVICFGKHSGKTIDELLKEDASYIDWMRENLGPEMSYHLKRIMES